MKQLWKVVPRKLLSFSLKPAEAALAAGVFLDGLEEVLFAELGPELIGNDDLCVADLPEEEVGDPHLA